MLQSGKSDEHVQSCILSCPQFCAKAQSMGFGGTPNQNFAQALAGALLGRSATAAEASAWAGQLPHLGKGGLAMSILRGKECRTDMASDCFQTLLQRPIDPVGFKGCVLSNLFLEGMRTKIECSHEFFANC
jgi:hypothetical protein